MKPPSLTERLLDSFIADPVVAEDVLGDLTEEWHERTEREGARAASWWYRKQAGKTVIHLLRSRLSRPPSPALLGALLVAGLPLLLFTGWAGLMTSLADLFVAMFGHGGGDGGETLPLTTTAPAIWAARALVASLACSFIGGLLLGLLTRRGAMLQVCLLAALWIPCALLLQALAPEGWPEWYRIALPAILVFGTLVGGVGGVAFERSVRRVLADGI